MFLPFIYLSYLFPDKFFKVFKTILNLNSKIRKFSLNEESIIISSSTIILVLDFPTFSLSKEGFFYSYCAL